MNLKKDLTIDILSSVQKPARYTGGEFASIVKPAEEVEATIALAFPDVYEVGMSYLGFKILYHLLNKEEGIAAERVYAPWIDLEAKMREREIVLCTLETKKALRECDIVGFTLQYELSYTNILNMLDLGGVPLLAKDRTDADPFVIVGGPCVYNPEPLADFFDFAVIGEGEEVLIEVMRCYKEWKREGKPGGRQEFLQRVVKIKGIYVPSFYEAEYNEDGTFKAIKPLREDIPAVIQKRVIEDMNSVDFPTSPIVPFGEIVHDRIMLEVFRGCSRGCRFCHAGMVYRPVRERKPEVLMDLSRKLVDNTGYNEISLVSLSSADYSCLAPLVHKMIGEFKDERVSVSLPSLRIDSFCVAIAKEVQAVRKSGLTFAPEAGSQRLRDVINKGLTEEVILQGSALAFEGGWTRVKLYFMLGHPTETEEDIRGIAELSNKIAATFFDTVPKEKRVNGRVQIVTSTSFFVPKPFTPFQWAPQCTKEEFVEKAYLTRKAISEQLNQKSIKYNWHEADVSVLEGVLARGDRKLSQVLLYVYNKGCFYDAWSEYFHNDVWMEAFAACGLDPDFYSHRERPLDEILPWDFLDCGVSRSFLEREWQKAKNETISPNCKQACQGCGAARFGCGICIESRD